MQSVHKLILPKFLDQLTMFEYLVTPVPVVELLFTFSFTATVRCPNGEIWVLEHYSTQYQRLSTVMNH